jgi:hypothetical protein
MDQGAVDESKMTDPQGNTEHLYSDDECERNTVQGHTPVVREQETCRKRAKYEPPEVYTTIVWETEATAHGCLRAQESSATRSCRSHESFIEIEDDDESSTCEDDSHEEDASQKDDDNLDVNVKAYSVGLGITIGCFIQLSSLGANFVFTELHTTEQASIRFGSVFRNSLMWSVFTSSMGVFALFLLDCLVEASKSVSTLSQHNVKVFLQDYCQKLENYFGIGSLVGVFLSSIICDLALGFRTQSLHCVATLLLALIWLRIAIYCFVSDIEESAAVPPLDITVDDDTVASDLSDHLKKPLVVSPHLQRHKYNKIFWIVRSVSLMHGILIGLFIQFSSLGANQMMKLMSGGGGPPSHVLLVSWNTAISFSLLWSLVASLMGGCALFLMRNIIIMAWWVSDIHKDILQHMSQNVECYFSVGAMCGINIAWLATDLILGLEVHIYQSIITTVAAMAWCKIVSCWYGLDVLLPRESKTLEDEIFEV